ncbi:MAG: hypothetical protein RL226_1980 [Bacteroidota bacterium]
MARRQWIFTIIRETFERYGFEPIETPAFENLSTLTGKYGEEGDQLIFKILNNGNFLEAASGDAYAEGDSKRFSFSISKKALRYDLTVPFARFVVMNQHALAFPFKRYQIQNVWRGDRPGKGRYQEFYQCDADIIGSDSLLNEVDLVKIFDEVLTRLGIPGFQIVINNRKVLAGIAELAGVSDKLTDMTVAIDKLDKIGRQKVEEELVQRGFSADQVQALEPLFALPESNKDALNFLEKALQNSEIGSKGVLELRTVVEYAESLGLKGGTLRVDPTLARGLNYYTGAIFEVKVPTASVGSICGGGRYDDLTGIFGLPGISGVGISFGADRIYDVLEEFNLFPSEAGKTTQLLFVNFGQQEERFCMQQAEVLRNSGLRVEVYPEAAKMKKQMKYADDKGIPFVALVGEEEMQTGKISVKRMADGEQRTLSFEELLSFVQA